MQLGPVPFQLWLGETTLPALIDRIADDACSAAPDLGRSRARDIADLIFRSRLLQTVACARHGVCADIGPAKWGGQGRLPIVVGSARPCHVADEKMDDLPNVFAVAVADALLLAGPPRLDLEERLATLFRRALLPYLFENEHCGHAPECTATRTDPFQSLP